MITEMYYFELFFDDFFDFDLAVVGTATTTGPDGETGLFLLNMTHTNTHTHIVIPSSFEEQKTRWAADSSFPVAQYGGVVVNPCRGFSMGSGYGPGQTMVAAAEKVGLRTKGTT